MKLKTNATSGGLLIAAILICPANAAEQMPVKIVYNLPGGDTASSVYSIAMGGKTIYGTTLNGGGVKGGVAFSLTPPPGPGTGWTEEALYSFPIDEKNGPKPYPSISFESGGVVYGTTLQGGQFGLVYGAVYQLSPPTSQGGSWTESDLYDFTGASDGSGPQALVESNSIIYGVTAAGGNLACGSGFGCGVFFSLTPFRDSGIQHVLYTFQGGSDDAAPNSLILGANGVLYGTSAQGGTAGQGTVFALTPSAGGSDGTEAVLYSFQGGADASYPLNVTLGSGGVLYGASSRGGSTGEQCTFGCGAIFSLTPPASPGGVWAEAVIYGFEGTDGAYPNAITLGAGGILYGTTSPDLHASLFSLGPPASPGGAWTKTVLHNFTDKPGRPYGLSTGLVRNPAGVLYGGTSSGGAANSGTVYSLRP